MVRLGTSGSGLFAETAVILPRPTGAAPGYLFSSGEPDVGGDRGGAGLVMSRGGAGVSRSGNRYVGSLFVGALPGSYFEIDQVQGSASLYGVPLPSRMTLPTTAVGGLNFRSQGKNVRWDATVGAFVNPAGLAPDDMRAYVREDNLGGGFAGFNIRKNNWTAGVDVLVDVDRQHNVGLGGVRLRLGFTF